MLVAQWAVGLRPGEACKLRTADVDADTGTLITPRDGKTGERTLGFDTDGRLGKALEGWREQTGPYLFGGDRALSVNSYRHAVTRYCRAAGVRVFRPYALRHTYACELMDAGVPIATIAAVLGHTSPMTTVRYYLHANAGLSRQVNAGR